MLYVSSILYFVGLIVQQGRGEAVLLQADVNIIYAILPTEQVAARHIV
jgi:hypothetical protein